MAMRRTTGLAGIALAASVIAGESVHAQELKIGIMAVLSGPQAVLGGQLRDGFMLGVKHAGGKLGGLTTTLTVQDDELKPDVAVGKAKQLVERDKVDFIVGPVFSNILLAIFKPITEAQVFLISPNAGPSPLAGKGCSPFFFATSYQNDQPPEVLGKYAQDKGFKKAFLLAPNYQAGKDMIGGFKRYFKNKIVGEVYTQLGQQDYQAEISQLRAANPKAVFVFYPGGMGIQFLKQYAQAGLRGQIPLYSVYTVDEMSLPAVKDAALGQFETRYWSPDLKNDANQKYVGDYRKKFGKIPTFYGAQSYDGIMLIDSAIRAVKGDLTNKNGMIAAMRKADYKSTRGPYKYNVNHFPIENFYLLKAVQDPSGELVMQIQKTVFENHKDSYAGECPMKW